MTPPFRNRTDAGQRLASLLRVYSHRPDVIVLALPRGGVPVAFEVARALHAPLDVLVVRKLGLPGNEELAMGAITSGGVEFHHQSVLESFQVSADALARVVQRERAELARRERAYRGDRPFPAIAGQTVILVDDGIATGSTMHAAVRALQLKHPAAIVVAVPVASEAAVNSLRLSGAQVITELIPEDFFAIGQFYRDFTQTSDADAERLLAEAAGRRDSQTDDLAAR
jgi:putative phosphoribosyl transferase